MNQQRKLRVLIVDDHKMVREALTNIIDHQPDMKVVAQASSGGEAIRRFYDHRPDLTLMDMRLLGGMSGVDATRRILEGFPNACVIAISAYEGDGNIRAALRAGARSYILKGSNSRDILRAMRQATSLCKVWISPSVASILNEEAAADSLTSREIEILELLSSGCTNDAIGHRLFIDPSSVKLYIDKILGKLKASSREHASSIALARGIIQPTAKMHVYQEIC